MVRKHRIGIETRGSGYKTSRRISQRLVFIFKVGRDAAQSCATVLISSECVIHTRNKDLGGGGATSDWFSELLSPNPWFKDVVPNVSA